MPCQCYTREPLSKLERTSPHVKINVTSKSPVGDISVVTLIRTDTTLDHSQKAEKVCTVLGCRQQGFISLSSAKDERKSVPKRFENPAFQNSQRLGV